MSRDDPPQTPADDDDASLFRRAMQGVRRHAATPRDVHRVTPDPEPRQRQADDRAVIAELLAEPDVEWLEHGETLSHQAPGVQDGVLRRLRRGHYRIDAELDLHGLNRERAQRAVVHFLAESQDRGRHCLRIIHGKGNRSPNSGPVLKTLLARWLQRHRAVLAYCSARPVDGGTGAVMVLLRKKP